MIMRPSFPIVLTVSLLLSASSGQIKCYRPNGDDSTHNDTKICTSLRSASMCCNVNDECLPNGICKVAATSGDPDSVATYWRDTCSESSWPDVGCLKVCATDGLEGDNSRITPCDGTDTSSIWCCGETTSCCGGDGEVHVPKDIYAVASTSSGTTSTSTSTSIPSQSSSGLSTGANAGIGVGVGVGASAIIALLLFFLRRHRRNKAAAAVTYPSTQPAITTGWQEPQELEPTQVYKKHGGFQNFRHELDGEPSTVSRLR